MNYSPNYDLNKTSFLYSFPQPTDKILEKKEEKYTLNGEEVKTCPQVIPSEKMQELTETVSVKIAGKLEDLDVIKNLKSSPEKAEAVLKIQAELAGTITGNLLDDSLVKKEISSIKASTDNFLNTLDDVVGKEVQLKSKEVLKQSDDVVGKIDSPELPVSVKKEIFDNVKPVEIKSPELPVSVKKEIFDNVKPVEIKSPELPVSVKKEILDNVKPAEIKSPELPVSVKKEILDNVKPLEIKSPELPVSVKKEILDNVKPAEIKSPELPVSVKKEILDNVKPAEIKSPELPVSVKKEILDNVKPAEIKSPELPVSVKKEILNSLKPVTEQENIVKPLSKQPVSEEIKKNLEIFIGKKETITRPFISGGLFPEAPEAVSGRAELISKSKDGINTFTGKPSILPVKPDNYKEFLDKTIGTFLKSSGKENTILKSDSKWPASPAPPSITEPGRIKSRHSPKRKSSSAAGNEHNVPVSGRMRQMPGFAPVEAIKDVLQESSKSSVRGYQFNMPFHSNHEEKGYIVTGEQNKPFKEEGFSGNDLSVKSEERETDFSAASTETSVEKYVTSSDYQYRSEEKPGEKQAEQQKEEFKEILSQEEENKEISEKKKSDKGEELKEKVSQKEENKEISEKKKSDKGEELKEKVSQKEENKEISEKKKSDKGEELKEKVSQEEENKEISEKKKSDKGEELKEKVSRKEEKIKPGDGKEPGGSEKKEKKDIGEKKEDTKKLEEDKKYEKQANEDSRKEKIETNRIENKEEEIKELLHLKENKEKHDKKVKKEQKEKRVEKYKQEEIKEEKSASKTTEEKEYEENRDESHGDDSQENREDGREREQEHQEEEQKDEKTNIEEEISDTASVFEKDFLIDRTFNFSPGMLEKSYSKEDIDGGEIKSINICKDGTQMLKISKILPGAEGTIHLTGTKNKIQGFLKDFTEEAFLSRALHFKPDYILKNGLNIKFISCPDIFKSFYEERRTYPKEPVKELYLLKGEERKVERIYKNGMLESVTNLPDYKKRVLSDLSNSFKYSHVIYRKHCEQKILTYEDGLSVEDAVNYKTEERIFKLRQPDEFLLTHRVYYKDNNRITMNEVKYDNGNVKVLLTDNEKTLIYHFDKTGGREYKEQIFKDKRVNLTWVKYGLREASVTLYPSGEGRRTFIDNKGNSKELSWTPSGEILYMKETLPDGRLNRVYVYKNGVVRKIFLHSDGNSVDTIKYPDNTIRKIYNFSDKTAEIITLFPGQGKRRSVRYADGSILYEMKYSDNSVKLGRLFPDGTVCLMKKWENYVSEKAVCHPYKGTGTLETEGPEGYKLIKNIHSDGSCEIYRDGDDKKVFLPPHVYRNIMKKHPFYSMINSPLAHLKLMKNPFYNLLLDGELWINAMLGISVPFIKPVRKIADKDRSSDDLYIKVNFSFGITPDGRNL